MTPPDTARRHHVYHAMDLTFRLNPKGKAIDAYRPSTTASPAKLRIWARWSMASQSRIVRRG
jgi:hypothetical protein